MARWEGRAFIIDNWNKMSFQKKLEKSASYFFFFKEWERERERESTHVMGGEGKGSRGRDRILSSLYAKLGTQCGILTTLRS